MWLGNTIHTIRSSNWLPSRPVHLEVGAHCSDGLLDPVDEMKPDEAGGHARGCDR